MEEKAYKSDQDQLKMLVRESNAVADALKKLETQIFTLETQYLQDECPTWNVIKGFDGFVERSQGMTRRPTVSRDDRVFSLSSHNSPAMSLPMDDDVRSVASGDSSPTHKTKRSHKKKSVYGEDDYE
ncbi:hypothetical protein WA171_003178 [Blastocystis sp. BT1]